MPGPTLQALAEKQAVTDLAVQRVQDDIRHHVEGCIEGQERIDKRFNDMDTRFDKLDAGIKLVSDAQISSASAAATLAAVAARPVWWQPLLRSAILALIGAVMALIGWMGGTIWNLQNERVNSALRREVPAASVTVNPSQAAPAQPTPPTPADTGQSAN